MRNRKLNPNPKTLTSKLLYGRNKNREAALLFEERRNIEGFLTSLKNKLQENDFSIWQLQKELNLNKKTIYRWFSKEKQPSQAMQKLVCDYLNIPYDKLILTPNENGDFPCGLRVCSVCNNEFALFKNVNCGKYRCSKFDCRVIRFDYKNIEDDWRDGVLTLEQLALKLKKETGQVVGITSISNHFKKLSIPRAKRGKRPTPL